MPQRVDSNDDPDDDEYAPEGDEAGDFWCPKCGAEMYGDASRCPACGNYVTPGARPSSGLPWWIWVGLILAGLTLLAGLLRP